MAAHDRVTERLPALSNAFRQFQQRPRLNVHRLISCCLILPILAMAFVFFLMPGPARAQEELRQNVSTLCKRVFYGVHVDAEAVVRTSWQQSNIERVIDVEVDRAIAETKKHTSYSRRFISGWSQETARQLAEEVATRAFTSEALKQEMERLAERIAVNLTNELEPSSQRAVERGLTSIQTYLGSNYSKHLVPALQRHVKEIHLQPGTEFGLDNIGDTAARHAVAISGITVIIASHLASKVLRQLTEKIFHRIVGRLVSRILGRVGTAAIPVVGWVIGAGMLAFDLVHGADGALPDIQKALKSHETKAELCHQVVQTFRQELPGILSDAQNELATEVFNIWLTFLGKYPSVLMLTRESALFRTEIVEKTPADSANFDRLAHLVEVSLKVSSKAEVIGLVERGILQQLKLLSVESHAIILETGSPQVLYQWSELAQERLIEVTRLGLYRHMKPTDLDRGQLFLLLEMKDPKSVENLCRLDLGDVKTALRIFPAEQLGRLVKLLDLDAMRTMVRYGDNAPIDVTEEFIRRLAADPRLIQLIGSDGLNQVFLTGGTVADLKSFLFWHAVKRWIGVLIPTGLLFAFLLHLYFSRWRKRPPVDPARSKGGAKT